MQDNNSIQVSLIIPVFTGYENLKYLLPAINKQTLLPREIVIVDSCSHTEVKELIDTLHLEIPIRYHREDNRAFPGKARNIGVSIAKYKYIAFLDCKTIPSNNWLHHYSQIIKENNTGIIAGSTKVLANSKFQWYLRTATYGTRLHRSVPGTLMEKQLFDSTGGFIEDLRMAEDLEWFKRLRKERIEFTSVQTPFLKYSGLPESLFVACLKYFESGYYTSFVMGTFKNLLYSAFLIATILIIPKWNLMLDGWDSNPLFIPGVTKILFLILIFLLLIWRFFYFFLPKEFPDNIFVLTAKISVLGIVTFSVLNWNATVAGWMQDAVMYIPHITKIYIGLLLAAVFIYRGLVQPIRNSTSYKELLPKNWFFVGIVGLLMDIVKIPGTIYGSLVGRLKPLITPRKTPIGK